MKLTSRSARIAVPAVATVALLGGGVAAADTTAPQGTAYSACVARAGHVLYDVTSNGTPRCLARDAKITWNQAGPQGATGATGQQGVPGPAGAPGKDGTAVLSGSGAPSNSVGQDGDFYIDTKTTTLYGPRAGDAWPATGTSLVGPQGAPGASGSQPLSFIATTANTDSSRIFNGGQAEVEAFCSGGPEFTLAHTLNGPPPLSVTGIVEPSPGATVSGDAGDLAPGFLSFTVDPHRTFWVRNGSATGELLVTQGSSTFTVTFALTGGADGCLSSVQVTPTS